MVALLLYYTVNTNQIQLVQTRLTTKKGRSSERPLIFSIVSAYYLTTSAIGFSKFALNVCKNAAPVAPSTTR